MMLAPPVCRTGGLVAPLQARSGDAVVVAAETAGT